MTIIRALIRRLSHTLSGHADDTVTHAEAVAVLHARQPGRPTAVTYPLILDPGAILVGKIRITRDVDGQLRYTALDTGGSPIGAFGAIRQAVEAVYQIHMIRNS